MKDHYLMELYKGNSLMVLDLTKIGITIIANKMGDYSYLNFVLGAKKF